MGVYGRGMKRGRREENCNMAPQLAARPLGCVAHNRNAFVKMWVLSCRQQRLHLPSCCFCLPVHFPCMLLHNNHPAVLIHVLFEVFFPSSLVSVIPLLSAALTSRLHVGAALLSVMMRNHLCRCFFTSCL